MSQELKTIAFTNVNVIPMDRERLLENQTVIVEGDRIAAVGPSGEVIVPEEAKVIEGHGAYLMPGLADMHMHITSIRQTFEGPDQLHLYLAEGVTTVRNMSAMPEHLVWQDEIARGERLGPTMYNGRMIVGLPDELRSMAYTFRAIVVLGPLSVGLVIWLLVWAGLSLSDNRVQFASLSPFILPTLGLLLLLGMVTAWLKIIPLNVYTSRLLPFAMVAETGAEARRYVQKIIKDGYDFVKLYDWLPVDAYLSAADEARKRHFYAIGHLLDELSLQAIFEGGLREAAHMDEFIDSHMIGEASPRTGFNEIELDYEVIPQSTAIVKAHEVMVVSNMVADETIYKLLEDPAGGLAQPEYAVVSAPVLEAWQTSGRLVDWLDQKEWRRHTLQPFLLTLTRSLYDAGVPMLIGTDMVVEGMVPAHIHRELELLVEVGQTPYAALEAGTKNAGISAQRMGQNDNFGMVAAGQRADLILLEKNPLENVSHSRRRLGVMARGRWFIQSELDALVNDYVTSLRAKERPGKESGN